MNTIIRFKVWWDTQAFWVRALMVWVGLTASFFGISMVVFLGS